MSLHKENALLEVDARPYHDYEWIGNPRSGDHSYAESRKRMTVIGRIDHDRACYSYDDYALVLLDGEYLLFNTSGCSCPSPCETWGVVEGPCSLEKMVAYIKDALEKEKEYTYSSGPLTQTQDWEDLIAYAQELAS